MSSLAKLRKTIEGRNEYKAIIEMVFVTTF